MPATLTVPTPRHTSTDATEVRRADRLSARSVLWRESSIERVRKCGRCILPGNDLGVSIRVSVDADGVRRAGIGGVETCGSVWVCPWCSGKIAATRQGELTAALRRWYDLGHGVVVATFTMKHRKGHGLKTLWDAVSLAWQRTTGGSGWKSDQALWGVPMTRTVKTGARAGDSVTETRIPTVRLVEVTHGRNGWHVHIHALLFVRHTVMDATAEVIGDRMFGRWSSALAKLGFEPDHEHGIDAHAPAGGADTIAHVYGEYFTKNTFDGLSGAAMDATRTDLKDARNGNRTPFAVLRGITGHADYTDGDLELWAEWEKGSHRRRQMTWTPGLRELVALPELEKTDEQIAAEEHGGATLCFLDRKGWFRIICRTPGLLAMLLDLAECDDGATMLLMALDFYGIGFQVPGGVVP